MLFSGTRVAFGLLAATLIVPMAGIAKECSTEKVNRDCDLTIDRVNPLQPPTLQMYSGAKVTVKVIHALPFEQVSLDWQTSTGNLAPDAAAAIANALSPNLQKLVATIATPPKPMARSAYVAGTPDQCATIVPNDVPTPDAALKCAAQMMADAKLAMAAIAPLANPDALVFGNPQTDPALGSAAGFDIARSSILCRILGSGLLGVNSFAGQPIQCASTYHDLVSEQQNLSTFANKTGSLINTAEFIALASYTNTIVTSLEAIAQDLIYLDSPQPDHGDVGTIVDPARGSNPTLPGCNSVLSRAANPQPYSKLLQRQVSCAVNVYNLVSNSKASIPTSGQKRTIVTIVVNFADSRFETSAGILLSALPSRSFSTSSTYTGTPPMVSDVVVQESDTRPLIVPYAALNIRLGSDWLWPDRRRGAIYATVLVGVNPNTTTADFGAGLSIAWRTLIISPVAHFTHDVRLTGGFTNGESLGATFSGALPTEKFWTITFGLGIGVRVPLIPGR